MIYDSIARTCYPHSRIEEDSYDWWARHNLKKKQVKENHFDVVFIGDSITHFWHDEMGRVTDNEAVWQEFYGKRKVLNLGYGFDRPQNVLYRLENGELRNQNPKLVVLNIGTNCFSITPRYSGDSPEVAFAGVRTVIEKIVELLPDTHLVLMEIFPRIPDEIQKKIDETNRLIEDYAYSDQRIILLSLHDKFRIHGNINRSLYADEGCHPNPAGYRVWAEALEPVILQYCSCAEN